MIPGFPGVELDDVSEKPGVPTTAPATPEMIKNKQEFMHSEGAMDGEEIMRHVKNFCR